MSDGNLRLLPPAVVFDGHYRHECLRPGCTNVMVVPDDATPGAPERLMEGQIWACAVCRAPHEYYLVLERGVRSAGVRLLDGVHIRGSAEPSVTEFLERETK